MKGYCRYPFTHIYSDMYNMLQPCCVAYCKHPYANQDDAQFKAVHIKDGCYNFYNSDQMQQLRDDMLKDDPLTPFVRDVCRNCIKMEEDGVPSIREPLDIDPLDPRVIDVKMKIFGNTCNLQCYMCNVKDSTGRLHQAKKLTEYNPNVSNFLNYEQVKKFENDGFNFDLAKSNPELFETQIENLKKLSPRINHFTIYGGEPFILESHYRLLDALLEVNQAKDIGLIYDSNLTLLQWSKYKILDYIKEFKWVNINWSVEGYGKYNDYIRFPSNWDTIVENVEEIRPYLHHFHASITVSSLSILQLDKLIDWLDQNQIGYKFNHVFTPEVCRVEALHPNIRRRLAEKYKNNNALKFLCKSLLEEVSDWEIKWNNLLEYLDAIDHVNRTNYKETFPELCDLSEDW